MGRGSRQKRASSARSWAGFPRPLGLIGGDLRPYVGAVPEVHATAFGGSLLDGPGFLAAVALHQNRLLAAALFQLPAAFTSAAIAVTLYPVPRQHAAAMALGSVAFRLIEGVFYALSPWAH